MRQLLIVIPIILPCIPLSAQEVEPGDTVVLDPVTVTVRAPRPAYTIPSAISATSGSAGGADLLGLSAITPGMAGVDVQDRYNSALGDRIAIRGFGARTQFGIRGIRVVVDGVPATLADGQTTLDHLDLATVSRVEVSRGLSSAQYGNSAGGVMLITTEPGGQQGVRLDAGAHGYRRAHAGFTAGRGDVRAALSGSFADYEGYRAHSESRRYFLNSRVEWASPRSSLTTTLSVVDFNALNPGGLDAATRATTPGAAATSSITNDARKDATQAQVGVALVHNFGTASLHTSAYGLVRDLLNPIPGRVIDVDRLAGGVQAFVQLNPVRDVTLTVGADMDLQADDRANFANDAGDTGSLLLRQDERVLGTAGFGQVFWDLHGGVTLMTSLRADRISFDVDDRFISDGDDSGTRAMTALSPGLGVNVLLGSGWSTWAAVGTGFETPTTTELTNQPDGSAGLNPQLDPQRSTSIEAGIRGALLQRVLFNVAAYRTPVREELVPFESESSGRTFFRNAGRSLHRGVELELTALVLPSIGLQGSYTLAEVEYVDFTVDGSVYDGNRVPGTPLHSASTAVTVARDEFWVRAGMRTRSAIPVDDANTAESPGTATFEASVGGRFRFSSMVGSAYLTVGNLFDADYDTAVTVNAFGGRYFEPGPGRTLSAGLSVFMAR